MPRPLLINVTPRRSWEKAAWERAANSPFFTYGRKRGSQVYLIRCYLQHREKEGLALAREVLRKRGFPEDFILHYDETDLRDDACRLMKLFGVTAADIPAD